MNPDPRSKPFWEFTFANCLQIGLIVFALIAGWFKVDNRLTNVESYVLRVDSQMQRIDKEGSYYAQQRVDALSGRMGNADTRITNQEAALQRIAPMVERVNANMEWIVSLMQKKSRYEEQP